MTENFNQAQVYLPQSAFLCAKFIEYLCNLNPNTSSNINSIFRVTVTHMSLPEFAHRLGIHFRASDATFIVASILAQRYYDKDPSQFGDNCAHKIFAAVAVIAAKWTEDVQHTHEKYAMLCCLRPNQLFDVEWAILTTIKFDVFVRTEEFEMMEKQLQFISKNSFNVHQKQSNTNESLIVLGTPPTQPITTKKDSIKQEIIVIDDEDEENQKDDENDDDPNMEIKVSSSSFSSSSHIENGRRRWTKEEDKKLISLVKSLKNDWRSISKEMKDRTPTQCSQRWSNKLCPDIKQSPFTVDEDAKLLSLIEKYGTKWTEITSEMPGRTRIALYNRYTSLKKRGMSSSSFSSSSSSFSSSFSSTN